MTRFIFMHGNGTSHWSFAFAPWLKETLEELGHETVFETMPDSVNARKKYWFGFLNHQVKVNVDDVIIGWSSGAVCGMRYAENHKFKGLILLGPHYTDLDDELEKQSGYFDDEWEWESIKNNVDEIVVIHGDNDPYIPTKDFIHISENLNCRRIEIQGAGHFEDSKEIPELVEILNTYSS